jgi:hypothetical protein
LLAIAASHRPPDTANFIAHYYGGTVVPLPVPERGTDKKYITVAQKVPTIATISLPQH